MPDKFDRIIADFARCRESRKMTDIFGANSHRFKTHPPLTVQSIEEFEGTHQCALPDEYRTFVTYVGNGGAGPGYGLFPLGMMDQGSGLGPWDHLVSSLHRPFRHIQAWNDLAGNPSQDLEEQDEAEYWRQINAFDMRYYSPEQSVGSFPICHMGCALRRILVVTGEEAGHVWCDHTADLKGYFPAESVIQSRMSFLDWYREWLDDCLRKL
jgi:hypothetical protein